MIPRSNPESYILSDDGAELGNLWTTCREPSCVNCYRAYHKLPYKYRDAQGYIANTARFMIGMGKVWTLPEHRLATIGKIDEG